MDKKKLDIFQILKNGTTFKSKNDKKVVTQFKEEQQKVKETKKLQNKRKRKTSSVDLSQLKFNPSDSEDDYENELQNIQGEQNQNQEKKPRRKQSIDQIEKNLQKKANQIKDKINQLKNQNRIKVEGDNVPLPISNFTKLIKKYDLQQKLVDNITKSGYKKLTPIQMQAIPITLEKRNLVALAPTGSGKTFAFSLPLLHQLGEHKSDGLRGLIFAPTIELAQQIEREITFLNFKNSLRIKFIQNINLEIKAFMEQIQNIDILICTPLKFLKVFKFLLLKKEEEKEKKESGNSKEILELQKKIKKVNKLIVEYKADPVKKKKLGFLRKKKLEFEQEIKQLKIEDEKAKKNQDKDTSDEKKILENLEYLVFDEVDKYFELDLAHQMKQILELFQDNSNLTYSLFSATIQYPVEELVKNLINDPVKLTISGKNTVLNTIEQKLSYCQSEFGKLVSLKNIINEGEFTPPVLIFVQSKERGKELLDEIRNMGVNTFIKIDFIHQDKQKHEREQIITDFRTGKLYALICTDLMARGIDFKGVNLVINYDFPQTMITYVHRVGRTGRANRQGKAITFFTDLDKPILRDLGNMLKQSGCEVPEWILSLKKMSKKDRKHLEKFPVKREHISRDPELQKEDDPEYDKILKIAGKYYKNSKKLEKKHLKKELQKQKKIKTGEDEWQVADEQGQDNNDDDDGWAVAGGADNNSAGDDNDQWQQAEGDDSD